MTIALEEEAALDFVLALRRSWAERVFPALRAEFDAGGGNAASPPLELADAIRELPTYGWFSWLERGSQKMLWRAVGDAVVRSESKPSRARGASRVDLDPTVALPDWYTDWDIHLQPGGVWSSAAAAQVYELGAKLVMMGQNDDYKFHRLFVETALGDREFTKIIDLGCGFGKSTWPLKKRFPKAEVTGVDLAAPCLRLAADRADELGLGIVFRQADASSTGLPSQAFDLVTSTMLVHELPRSVLCRLFAEARRLLVPGGVLAFLDFQPTGDGFQDFAMIEHSSRNNEPFMAPMMATDLVTVAGEAGFRNVYWSSFDEREKGDLGSSAPIGRSEWRFPWAVLHAEAHA